MDRYFTKTFFKFFFGFLIIIAIAFGVLIGTSKIGSGPVDTVAYPQ